MTKIKVVQIAMAASTDDTWDAQYVDDLGRVWYQDPVYNEKSTIDPPGIAKVFSHYEWKQLELPEEPRE